MIILAIETSCDETAIAVLKSDKKSPPTGGKILSNIVSSQVKIHAKWGGVVPNLAKREHIKNLPIVLKKALKEAKIKSEKIDVIAVTVGPGLEPALWTGINFAQKLAKKWKKPIIAVNHMEGHILSVLLKEKSNLKPARPAGGSQISKIKFPVIALLVSGGHTELVLMRKWLDYKIIGQTRDDAAGEAFDKVAKMLGLPYPGGPVVAELATIAEKNLHSGIISRNDRDGRMQVFSLPRPMIKSKDYDFSFSGLKTAVLYLIKDLQKNIPKFSDSKDLVASICHEFQQAVIDVLISKTLRAAKEYRVKTIILGGGVAANEELRKQFNEIIKKQVPRYILLVPRYEFTGDNAAMIALAAYFRAVKKSLDKLETEPSNLKADGNLKLTK